MFTVIDNFYNDPENVRALALSLGFTVIGNYPGLRTAPCGGPWFYDIQKVFEKIIGKKITYFPQGYNTAFQYTNENSKTWVHHDDTEWAAVVYLTPNAPIEAGTGIFRHKETGVFLHEEGVTRDFNKESVLEQDWELIASSGNIFNRLVLYKGNYYHRSLKAGFGIDQHNGRLFQTFFFNT